MYEKVCSLLWARRSCYVVFSNVTEWRVPFTVPAKMVKDVGGKTFHDRNFNGVVRTGNSVFFFFQNSSNIDNFQWPLYATRSPWGGQLIMSVELWQLILSVVTASCCFNVQATPKRLCNQLAIIFLDFRGVDLRQNYPSELNAKRHYSVPG